MANIKLTELDPITALDDGDVLVAVDVSADKTHKITATNLYRTLPDGTATAPALAFSSDQGNGVFLAATDTVGIAAGGASRATFDSNGVTSTAFNTSSDYRLKENIVDLDGAINRVKQLQPRRFNFIADAERTVDGFVAHEAATVVPEAVTGTHNEVDDDGNAVMQGIDQSKLVPLLTAALQEAISEIETLKTKVAALEAA